MLDTWVAVTQVFKGKRKTQESRTRDAKHIKKKAGESQSPEDRRTRARSQGNWVASGSWETFLEPKASKDMETSVLQLKTILPKPE